MKGARHGSDACGAGDLGAVKAGKDLGPCPSCGSLLKLGTGVDPTDGKVRDMLLHPMPFCDYFGASDPDVVMRDLKKAALS